MDRFIHNLPLVLTTSGLLLFSAAMLKVLYDLHKERDAWKRLNYDPTRLMVDRAIQIYERQLAN